MSTEKQVEAKEQQLIRQFGVMLLSGRGLQSALGYRTLESLRQAIKRGTVPVPVFPVENRKGKFALPKDVARWLVQIEAVKNTPPSTAKDRDEPGSTVTTKPKRGARRRDR